MPWPAECGYTQEEARLPDSGVCCTQPVHAGDVISAADLTVAHLIAAANGEQQKAEILRHGEIAFPLRGVTFYERH